MAEKTYDEKVQALREGEPHFSSSPRRGMATTGEPAPKQPVEIKGLTEEQSKTHAEIIKKLRAANERMTKIKQAGAAGVLGPLRKEKVSPTRSTYTGDVPADAVPRFIEALLGEEGQERSRRENLAEAVSMRDPAKQQASYRETRDQIAADAAADAARAAALRADRAAINTDIYAEYLPEHLQDDPDALAAAAEDAAIKDYDELLEEYGATIPGNFDKAVHSRELVELGGETWQKIVLPGGETFYTSPDGEQVLRDQDTRILEEQQSEFQMADVLYDYNALYADEDDGP